MRQRKTIAGLAERGEGHCRQLRQSRSPPGPAILITQSVSFRRLDATAFGRVLDETAAFSPQTVTGGRPAPERARAGAAQIDPSPTIRLPPGRRGLARTLGHLATDGALDPAGHRNRAALLAGRPADPAARRLHLYPGALGGGFQRGRRRGCAPECAPDRPL